MQTKTIAWNPTTVLEAFPDAVTKIFGEATQDQHPLASRIAQNFGLSHVAALLTRDDFAAAFAAGLGAAVGIAYGRVSAHRRIARDIPVASFRAVPLVDVDLRLDAVDLDENTAEHGEARQVYVAAGDGETIAVQRKSMTLAFSPELIRSDDLGVAAYIIANLVAVCARREQRAVFKGLIGANPVLADARPVYSSVDGNDLGSAATLSLASFGNGTGAMARQKTRAGNECGVTPRFLVVAPEQKIAALNLLRQITPDATTPPLEVIVVNEIPSNAWYLFADPAIAPVIGFATLRHLNGETITTRESSIFEASAPAVVVDHVFGAAILSRVGTVRGGV